MRILAAELPEYFPASYLFIKMMIADVFVLADDMQFSKHSTINRTKIMTRVGIKNLTVPVLTSKKGFQRINEVQILPESNWYRKHAVALKSNYKYSPFFDHYFEDYKDIFNTNWKSLIKLDAEIILKIRDQLKINKEIILSSEQSLVHSGTKRIIELAKLYNCDTYLIFETEEKFVDKKLLQDENIDCITKKIKSKQSTEIFDVSIIDLLFNFGNESVIYLRNSVI